MKIVFVSASERVRRSRLEKRGDNLTEINRRIKSDREVYSSIKQMADMVIINNGSDIKGLEQDIVHNFLPNFSTYHTFITKCVPTYDSREQE